MEMNKKIIIKIIVSARPAKEYIFNSYKIMPRAQNAHAYVNASFLIQMSGEIVQSAHASPEFRRTLACGLLYKFILGAAPEGSVKEEFKSGGDILRRPLSTGSQIFDTRKDMYPVTKPIPKVEALVQCSGEAFYMNDLAPIPGELWAAFVHATQVNSKIAKIDPADALKIPGVVAFYCAKDIPGEKHLRGKRLPLGVIIAESPELAKEASDAVKVIYEKMEGVVMPTMADVFENKAFHRIQESTKASKDNDEKIFAKQSKHIQGNFDIGGQYHYTMEPQTCVCIPTEDGMDVYSASQWMALTQCAISNALNMTSSKIFVQIRRLGGGYGFKISRSVQIACSCALACLLLNRPVRFVQSLESMMNSLGKRYACHSDYEVDVDEKGKIAKLGNIFYEDCGSALNDDPTNFLTKLTATNCYEVNAGWNIVGKTVKTDAPSHTWCRGPGPLEGIAMIENIMEHIAYETQQDPVDVRYKNLKPGIKMETLLPDFLKSTEYKARKKEIIDFNRKNRWRKRGLGLAVMQYPIHYFGIQPATVTIYQSDGSVSVSHGGIEMGQGINTKAAQVAAYTLGIPLEQIRIHPSDSFNGANAIVTGGGVASESVCYAIKKACEELLERMRPFRDTLKTRRGWK
ncbi:unnamed protein product [Hermetia illucens]|uniref:Aldehyde oxidase/xanthine dehydrogenase a/b hammerhead domain-containing protein n=1 Tax=Hermetia illucens TaxID=343691 RepID=A0A7R8UD14_HERIL|nr:unnamed protein product [Hermetia illucens]